MEFVRSSFVGNWRLFTGNADLLTLGRYVFAPPGTPLYEDGTNLWSRNWISDCLDPWPDLGQAEGKTEWDNGSPGGPYPLPIRLGSKACIANGESFYSYTSDSDINGYPSGCWVTNSTGMRETILEQLDVQNRAFRLFACDTLSLMYSDPAAAEAKVRTFVGASAAIARVDNSPSIYPGTIIATDSTYTLCLISGTTNEIQFSMQVMNVLVPIQRFGQYSTLGFWQLAATRIALRLSLTPTDSTKSIVFCGHSYGGVVACLLAAQMKWINPSRDIRVLTFGSPKPGDSRLHTLLAAATNCHLANDGDPIPAFPPSRTELLTVIGLTSEALANRISTFRPQPGRAVLFEDGSIADGNGTTLTSAAFLAVYLLALANGPYPAYAAHQLSVYHDRLLLSV